MTALINEEVAAQALLKAALEADPTLMGMVNGISLRSVSDRLSTPFVKIDRQDASDLVVVGMARVWSDLTYLVRGITTHQEDPEWTEVGAIADRIENVLSEAVFNGTTATVYCVRRMEPFTDETIESGDLFKHAGGIYEMYAQAL